MTKEMQMAKAHKRSVLRAQRGSHTKRWWALRRRFIVRVFMANIRAAGL